MVLFKRSFSETYFGKFRKKTCGGGRDKHRLPSLRLGLPENKSGGATEGGEILVLSADDFEILKNIRKRY